MRNIIVIVEVCSVFVLLYINKLVLVKKYAS